MVKQYFKQAAGILKENKLTSFISILGTALSVSMILVIVLQFQIKQFGYRPESNRSRMLYILGINVRAKNGNENNNTSLSSETVRECIYSLKKPEAVTAIAGNSLNVSLPEKKLFDEYEVTFTDAGFWKVFDFKFLVGYPFSESDFLSGLPVAVVTDRVARTIFGSLDVTGRNIVMNSVPYTITGVVEETSKAGIYSYADIWVPYTSNSVYMDNKSCDGLCGPFQAVILARTSHDFDAIKADLQREVTRYNDGKADYVLTVPDPYTQLDLALGSGQGNGLYKVRWKDYLATTGSLLLFLLLVPTLNLTGVMQASVQKRRSEMGIRMAFGATKNKLLMQILIENLIVTLIGGIIGMVLSVVILYACKSFLLTETTLITFEMLFKPTLFLAALFFSLLLNLLSAGLPAFRTSRAEIVEALKDETK